MPYTFHQLETALADRYRLIRELGEGGMATVHLAEDLKHRRNVAIKVFKPELAAALGGERFLREIEITARLNHPHILPLLDSGAADGLLYYIMPFVEGESLRDRIAREKQLPVDEAVRIACEAAAALSYAHSMGFVHRDIKPENVLLSHGEAVIADFGISRVVSTAGAEQLTAAGTTIGTPGYMSPEQASGDDVDARGDIYSLACVLFEMLVGEPPFTGPSAQAVMARHAVEPAPGVRTVRRPVPDYVESAIHRALEKVPADRFGTATQFAAALAGELVIGPRTAGRSRAKHRTVARLRQFAHAIRDSWVAKITTIAVLGAGGVAALWWAGGVGGATAVPAETASPLSQRSWRSPTAQGWTAITSRRPLTQLESIADSLLFVSAYEEMYAFDGTSLNQVQSPRFDGTLFESAASGSFFFTRGYEVAYLNKWTAAGIQRLDSLAVDVNAAWFDGNTAVIAAASGGMYRKSAGGDWRQESTGTINWISPIWGAEPNRMFGIVHSREGRDSLAVFDGVSWRLVDLYAGRTLADSGTWLQLRDGMTFANGATVVVGFVCDGAAGCHAVLFEQAAVGRPWEEVVIDRPEGVAPTGVWGRSDDDLYIWSGWCADAPDLCLFRLIDGNVVPAQGLPAELGVAEVIGVGGVTYAATHDGRLWSEVGDRWAFVDILPSASFVAVQRVDSLTLLVRGRGDILLVWDMDRNLSLSREGRAAKALWHEGLLLELRTDGIVHSQECERRSDHGLSLVCTNREPGLSGVEDIAVLPDGRILAIGGNALVAWFSGGLWRRDSLPAPASTASLRRIVIGLQGQVGAVGDHRTLQLAPDGTWSVTREGGVPVGQVIDAVVLGDSTLALVGSDRQRGEQLYVESPAGRVPLARAPQIRIDALPDGRLVAAFGAPGDPRVVGWLSIWAPPYERGASRRFALPHATSVSDLDHDGEHLYVVGTARFAMKVPLDSLPFAAASPGRR